MTGGYTKLFSSLLASTVWNEPHHVRVVWITVLAMANKHGIVEGSIPGLAHMARVTPTECREAIDRFLAPDPDSRNQYAQGRRLEVVPGGWRLINHAVFRDKVSTDDRREYLRQKQADRRARQQMSTHVNTGDSRQQMSTLSTQSESDTDPDPSPDTDADTHADPTDALRAPARAPVWRQRSKAIALVQPHRSCDPSTSAACARGICVPAFLAKQWAAQTSIEYLRAFVGRVCAQLPDGPVGDDGLRFWRAQWEAAHTSYAPDTRTKAGRTMAALGRVLQEPL